MYDSKMPSNRCAVCANSDLRRLVELGWNAGMSAADISHGFGGVPSPATITKHLKSHVDGSHTRQIEVQEARPLRERVLAIQRAQIDAIERNLEMATRQADDWNEEHRGHEIGGDCVYCKTDGFLLRDPAWYFNILSKDMQSAIGSILKAQGLSDKREAKVDGNKIDLMRMMLGASGGRPPSDLIGSGEVVVEGEAREVDGG